MSVLDPLTHVLAAVLAAAHAALTSLGADPDAGLTWLLCVAAVVVVVRGAMLPLAIHGVRQAHAAARARPDLQELTRRYRGRTDAASVQAHLAERRRITTEHGVSRLGCLPLLAQLPIWWALYHLLSQVAATSPVGAMHAGLVASLATATLVGVPLAGHGYAGAGLTHVVVVAGLAGTAALLSFVTQRFLVAPNAVLGDLPESLATAHRLLPALSAVGLLVAAAVVPVALLGYWVCNGLWTLGWSAVVWRWWPTPGSPAALRRVRPA